MSGLIGKKIGMTREFFKTGQSVPVTVLKIEKGRVIQLIDKEKRGYNAIQLGFGAIKNSKLSKSSNNYAKYINEIFNKEMCISPLKSLAVHITNVNSSYGLSPYINYMKLWEENENV